MHDYYTYTRYLKAVKLKKHNGEYQGIRRKRAIV
jgi:hypothetical protein